MYIVIVVITYILRQLRGKDVTSALCLKTANTVHSVINMANDTSVTRRKRITVRIPAPVRTFGKDEVKMRTLYAPLDRVETSFH